mgnify:CR=1 FL=1
MNFLLSTIALLLGPFIYAMGRRNATAERLLDAFVVLAIAWIVGVHIVPEVIATGGVAAVGVIAIGMAFPCVLRRIFHLASSQMRFTLLSLAATALALHAIIDGIALLPAMGDPLSVAVILHRLPIGMAIWWTFRPAIGRTAAITAFAILIAATAFSYFLADPVVDMLENRTLAYFQAFVSGSLIDLVVVGAIEKFRKRPQLRDR